MSERTFKPFADGTVSLAVTSASARVSFTERHNGATCRVLNSGGDLVFIKFGDVTVVANENDIPLPGNWAEVFAVPDDATHCAAISNASPGSNTLYITPGDGD